MSAQTAPSERPNHAGLPVKRSLTPAYAASLAIALLVTVAAVAGLLYRRDIYQTEGALLFGVPTDVVSLVVTLPILLGAMGLARRAKLVGLLLWPGALLYVLYIYLVYTVGVPLNALFLVYLLLVTLSAYTTIGLVASIDAEGVRRRLAGKVPARWAGGILAVLAALFLVVQIGDIVSAMAGRTSVEGLDLSPFIGDFIVLAPTWLIGGVLLWQRRALGYVAGAGLLFVASTLFAGVGWVVVFPTLNSGAPLDVGGVASMLAMAAICILPLAFYVRGIVRS